MEKIKSITEAFSMQPITLKITTQIEYDAIKESKSKGYSINTNIDELIKYIKYEQLQVVAGGPDMYYIGYNFEGKKLFQYLASTVNVHFLI